MVGKIVIDIERCKGCGLCVVVCPEDNITISKKSNKNGYFPAQAANSECTGCAMCAIICPDVAIEVYRDEPDRVDIVEKVNKEVKQVEPCESRGLKK